jgi:hypothetical protein
MMLFDKAVESGATFSSCQRYRYRLWRTWDSSLQSMVCIGLNPSTADATNDDPTIRRVIGFAKFWGFGSLVMLNIFAYRATNPLVMLAAPEPVGPENDATILAEVSKASLILVAWGDSGKTKGKVRAGAVVKIIGDAGKQALCLGMTRSGSPRHPLYVPADYQPIVYKGHNDAG